MQKPIPNSKESNAYNSLRSVHKAINAAWAADSACLRDEYRYLSEDEEFGVLQSTV